MTSSLLRLRIYSTTYPRHTDSEFLLMYVLSSTTHAAGPFVYSTLNFLSLSLSLSLHRMRSMLMHYKHSLMKKTFQPLKLLLCSRSGSVQSWLDWCCVYTYFPMQGHRSCSGRGGHGHCISLLLVKYSLPLLAVWAWPQICEQLNYCAIGTQATVLTNHVNSSSPKEVGLTMDLAKNGSNSTSEFKS